MRMPNDHSHSQELLLFMSALLLANQMKLLANAKRDKNAKNCDLSEIHCIVAAGKSNELQPTVWRHKND